MKNWIATFAVLCMALPATAEPFRIVVTDLETPLVPNSVMDLAESGGYFDRAGVDVEFVRVQQTPMAMAALRAGEGEMANVSLESLLQAVGQGVGDLRAVTSPNKALPFLIAARDGISGPQELAGKKFGVGRIGSVDHTLTMTVLEKAGVDTSKLEIVALGQPSARAQALLAGQIDATTMSIGTFSTIDDNGGIGVIVDVGDYFKAAPIVSKINAVTTATLESRRPEVEAVIEALTLASRDFARDPAKWSQAMHAARPDVPQADLDMLGRAFAGSWSVNGGMHEAELQASADWLHATDDFKGITPAKLEDWANLGPVNAVLTKIGTSDEADLPTQ